MRNLRRWLSAIVPSGETLGPLTTNLVAFWPMSETSGDRAELVNGYTLTDDAAGIGSSANGHIYANCLDINDVDRSLTRAYSAGEQWDFGDTDWTIAYWIWCAAWQWATSYHYMGVVKTGRSIYGDPGYEVKLCYNNGSACLIYPSGPTLSTVSHALTLTGSAWQLVAHCQDTANSQAASSANGGDWTDVKTLNGASVANNTDLIVCFEQDINPQYRLGPLMMWDRKLSADDLALLYNSGNGLTYDELRIAS